MKVSRDTFSSVIFRGTSNEVSLAIDGIEDVSVVAGSLLDLQTSCWKASGLPGEALKENWVSPIHTGTEVRSYTGVECVGRMKMSIEGAGVVLLAGKGHAASDSLGKHGREKSSLSGAVVSVQC